MPQAQSPDHSHPAQKRFFRGVKSFRPRVHFCHGEGRRIPANSVVTTHGTFADHLYFLMSGSMRMFYTTADGRKVLLLWVVPGELLGGASLLATRRHYLEFRNGEGQ